MGFVGDGLDSLVIIAIWACDCREDGDGSSFHWPLLYRDLLGLTDSNCCSKGEEVAPVGTYKGADMKGGPVAVTTTADGCWRCFCLDSDDSSRGSLGEDESC